MTRPAQAGRPPARGPATRSTRPARDFLIDLRTWPRDRGGRWELALEPSAPQDWGGGLIRLPAGGPIRLELVLEAVGQGIWLTGRAAFELVGQCARCLDPINRPAQAELQDLFLRSTRAPDGPDDDSALIQDDVIDLEPLVRDAIVIDLPLAPLCYDDCAGLCASCGANLNREPAHRHGPAADRRWAALADWVPSQSETTG